MIAIMNAGSCVDAGFSDCCVGDDCEVFSPSFPSSCFCDALCNKYRDCCDDVSDTGCVQNNGY